MIEYKLLHVSSDTANEELNAAVKKGFMVSMMSAPGTSGHGSSVYILMEREVDE